MRMIALNFGGLGDEVLFLPTLKSIKLEHPDWHISLLTEPRARSIKQLTDLIDESITFDIKKKPLLPADYIELVSLLRGGGYDLILSSGGSAQVSILLFLSGIKTRVGYDSGRLSRMLLTAAVPLKRDQYAGIMYHDLVKGLGIERHASNPQVILNDESISRMQSFLSTELNCGTTSGAGHSAQVIIHPGTSRLAVLKGIIKVWAAENWCALIERLLATGRDVVLAGGPEDEEAVEQILTRLGNINSQSAGSNRGRFISACGKTTNVADLAALINLSTLMICVDSAPMHIAAGVGKSLVALFGPTDPEKLLPSEPHFIALKEQTRSVDATGVQIPVDTVFQAAETLLQASPCSG